MKSSVASLIESMKEDDAIIDVEEIAPASEISVDKSVDLTPPQKL